LVAFHTFIALVSIIILILLIFTHFFVGVGSLSFLENIGPVKQ